MDFLTQHFISLARKLRDDLAELKTLLSSINENLHKQVQSENVDRKAAEETPSPATEIRSVANAIEAVEAEHRASSRSQAIQHKRDRIAAWSGVIAVILYTTVALWQAILLNESIGQGQIIAKNARIQAAAATRAANAAKLSADAAKSSSDSAIAVNRPVVVAEVTAVQIIRDSNGKNLRYQIDIRNYGPVAALNARIGWRVYLDGVLQQPLKYPNTAVTLPPAQIVHLAGIIGYEDFDNVMSGKKTLEVEAYAKYDGPNGHYNYCDKQHFDSEIGSFVTFGYACTH